MMGPGQVAATFGEGAEALAGAWREGDALVVAKAYHLLPDRCVKCNAPAEGYRWKKHFYWHPPMVYLALVAGLLIYAIIALVTRKDGIVMLGVCPKHRIQRRNGLIVGWVGFLACFFGMLMGVAVVHPDAIGIVVLLSLLGMVVFPVIAWFMARIAAPKRIDDFTVQLKVGLEFLASMPDGPPQGYGAPHAYAAPYGAPPGSYGAPPGSYGAPPGPYGAPPQGWAPPNPGWGPPGGST